MNANVSKLLNEQINKAVSYTHLERRKHDVSKRIGTAFRHGAAAGRLRCRAADCAEGKELSLIHILFGSKRAASLFVYFDCDIGA